MQRVDDSAYLRYSVSQVSSSSRKILIWFSVLSSIVFVLSLGTLSDIGIIGPLIWGIVSVVLVVFTTSPKRKFFIPLCFALFLVVGIQLNAANLFFNADRLDFTVFSPHRLAVDSKIFFDILLELFACVCALLLATLILERFSISGTGLPFFLNSRSSKSVLLDKVAVLYFLICGILIVFMGHLGIGITGLPPEVELPFKLTGILVYVKNVALPFFGYLLFIGAVNSGYRGRVFRIAVMLFLLGLLGSVTFLSRGFVIFMIGPALIHLFVKRFVWQRSYRKLILMGLVGFCCLAVAVNIIKIQREAKYFGYQYSWIDSVYESGSSFILESFRDVFDLVVGRVSGFREIALAHTISMREGSLPLALFLGNQDAIAYVAREGFNFVRSPDDFTAFGYSLGLLGTLSLGNSFVIVFFGTFLFLIIGLILETLSLKVSMDLGTIFGFSYLFSVWGGLDIQHFMRLILIFLMLLMCTRVLISKFPYSNTGKIRGETR